MKKIFPFISLLFLLAVSSGLHAQSQDDMKAFMDYMTPGPIQQMMAKSVGIWAGAVTFWQKEGAPPMTSTTETVNEMILGGRFLKGTSKGSMFGMTFEGVGITGYDNAKKLFVNSWIDNMGTGMIFMEGSWDAGSNSINFAGKSTDPITKKDVPTREVWKFVDDTHQSLEMYYTADGKEFKSMEIKYTKK